MSLPAMAILLIKLVGQDAAMRMMAPAAYGGKSVDLPKGELGRGQRAFDALAETVGMDNAHRLCKHFGGDRVYIPRCDALGLDRRNRNIVAAYNGGVSVWQLASDHVLSDRQIWTILKKTDMRESAQTNLF
ncbi:MAG: hypothetical protein GZ090_01515 [Oxalobacteraceae bacterium]|nr:hypothetical protein [Oxalobacteraceae bacterium]